MNAIELAFAAIDKDGAAEPTLSAMAKGLMVGYDHRWVSAGWETVELEQEYILPIINPETNRQSRTFQQAGKIDTIVRWPADGRLFMVEHKTCSEDIEDPAATYWWRLVIESQVSQYILAKWQSGMKLDGTLYDVVRKPGIRPKQVTKPMQAEIGTGKYCGFDLHPGDEVHDGSETPTLYMLRVAREAVDSPERYFGRKSVPRTDGEVLEFASELWDGARNIADARSKNRHLRYPDSCMTYGRACPYLGLCSGSDHLESDTWEKVPGVHKELSTIPGDGRDVLTNTRMRTFQTCPRKHYYRYELGIQRAGEDRSEALYFGTLWHTALEAWWSYFIPQKEEDDGYSNGSPATAVGDPAASAGAGS